MVKEGKPAPDFELASEEGGHAMTVPEAELKKTDAGLIPQGDGWFVLNARDASWIRSEERGQDTDFEGGQEWAQLGFRIQVLMPGQLGI